VGDWLRDVPRAGAAVGPVSNVSSLDPGLVVPSPLALLDPAWAVPAAALLLLRRLSLLTGNPGCPGHCTLSPSLSHARRH
jgi:hypothetical protein